MKKRVCFILAAVFMTVGGVLFVVASAVNYQNGITPGAVNMQTNTYEITETSFGHLRLETSTADIRFVKTDDGSCRVVCTEYEDEPHTVSVEAGTLTIRSTNNHSWFGYINVSFRSPAVTVYLPADKYTSLTVRESTGGVEIPSAFAFEMVDITASTGNVDFFASAVGELKISTSTGAIAMENTAAEAVTLSVSTGNVKLNGVRCTGDVQIEIKTGKTVLSDLQCRNLQITGSTGKAELTRVLAEESLRIQRSTGDVQFTDCDAGEVRIETSTGDVRGSFRTDKIVFADSETGSVKVPRTTSGGRCEIHTDTGDVNVWISE